MKPSVTRFSVSWSMCGNSHAMKTQFSRSIGATIRQEKDKAIQPMCSWMHRRRRATMARAMAASAPRPNSHSAT